jgi:hypothetical protein
MEECVDEQFGFEADSPGDQKTDWLQPHEQFERVIGSEILYEKYHARAMARAVLRHLSRRPVEGSIGRKPGAHIVYVNRDTRFLCADGILWGFVCEACEGGLAVQVKAGGRSGHSALGALFLPHTPPAELERARARAAEAGAEVAISLISCSWPDGEPKPDARSEASHALTHDSVSHAGL